MSHPLQIVALNFETDTNCLVHAATQLLMVRCAAVCHSAGTVCAG
jgi:hypothetical protein